jgi:hypothetical protein
LIDWLIIYGFTSRSRIFHHCWWRAAKFRLMLGAQGLWAGRDLYRATSAVTRDLSFSCLIRRTAPFSCFLRHTRGCGGSPLTQILTGLNATWDNAFAHLLYLVRYTKPRVCKAVFFIQHIVVKLTNFTSRPRSIVRFWSGPV